MKREGNYPRGERHPMASCTDADVEMAVELVETYGLSLRQVAEKFGVDRSCVWKWVHARRRGPGAEPA